MKVKAGDLTGRALDWAVAMCEGAVTELVFDGITHGFKLNGNLKVLAKGWTSLSWHPSTDWSQGGPIIEREFIAVWFSKGDWKSQRRDTSNKQHGPTPLIAAMRCLVASKLGEEVEIPEELLK